MKTTIKEFGIEDRLDTIMYGLTTFELYITGVYDSVYDCKVVYDGDY